MIFGRMLTVKLLNYKALFLLQFSYKKSINELMSLDSNDGLFFSIGMRVK